MTERSRRLYRARQAALLLLAGCANAPPELPAVAPELARLEMLTGEWRAESTATIEESGEAWLSSAHVLAEWDLGGRFVVARTHHAWQSAAGGGEMESETWFTWDAAAGSYRTWTFQSNGRFATGTMRYEEGSRTWHMEEEWTHPETGARGRGAGTMEYIGETEKNVSWRTAPSDGSSGAFKVEGRSRRIRR